MNNIVTNSDDETLNYFFHSAMFELLRRRTKTCTDKETFCAISAEFQKDIKQLLCDLHNARLSIFNPHVYQWAKDGPHLLNDDEPQPEIVEKK